MEIGEYHVLGGEWHPWGRFPTCQDLRSGRHKCANQRWNFPSQRPALGLEQCTHKEGMPGQLHSSDFTIHVVRRRAKIFAQHRRGVIPTEPIAAVERLSNARLAIGFSHQRAVVKKHLAHYLNQRA
jgi:hypothetical protein